MAFVYESDPSELGLEKIRLIREKLNQKMSRFASWVVDVERDLAMLCFEGGNSRDNEITPGRHVLAIGEDLVTYWCWDYGLFCDFEKKVMGIEYLVYLDPFPESLVSRAAEMKAYIREAMACYGYQMSSRWATVTEVEVKFTEDFNEFQRRYDQKHSAQ
jgi:hypothetical protein